MADSAQETRSIGVDPSLSRQVQSIQTSPTLTSSGTLYDQEEEKPPCAPIPAPRAPRQSFWKSIRSLLRRHVGERTAQDEVADVERSTLDENGIPEEQDEPVSEPTRDDEKEQFITRSLKYIRSGYPNLATFLDSDENFMLYRRFGYLQSRVLLEKQDDLRQLEEQLDELDSSEQYCEPDNLFSRADFGQKRRDVLSSIEQKFCQYSQLLISAQQLQAFNKPTKSEHRSVLNYIHNAGPVAEEESKFTLCKEDLITLRPGREHAWLDRAIEKVLRVLHWGPFSRPLEYLFVPRELKEKRSDESQVFYGKERIEGCSSVVITLMIVFMLILPIYLLYHLVKRTDGAMSTHENAVYMGILLVFTLAFAAMMSFFTKAKRHEILGAAAAYCAVLVVFLGNLDTA